MKTYNVTYSGNALGYQGFEEQIYADSPREAVESVYEKYFSVNYFPQEDGSILDCDGNEIAESSDECIYYDGGYFDAEEIEEDEQVELRIAKTYEDAKLFAEDILDCEEIEIEGNSYPNEYNGFCRCKCGLTLLYYFHEINDLCNITTIGVCESCGESYYTVIDELEDLCRRQ